MLNHSDLVAERNTMESNDEKRNYDEKMEIVKQKLLKFGPNFVLAIAGLLALMIAHFVGTKFYEDFKKTALAKKLGDLSDKIFAQKGEKK
jgi:hypothetical protein